MRMRKFLAGATMLIIMLVSAKANSQVINPVAAGGDRKDAAPVDSNKLSPVPSVMVSKDKALWSAYLNTLSILGTNNGCSDFFGGAAAAVDVFRQLFSKVRKNYDQTAIGMRMSGGTVNVRNVTTRTEYRLFDKVSINVNGPFYRRRPAESDIQMPRVATFEPNSREVRVLMFLHELGHVIKGEDGNWLLPDDGGDESVSRQNSRKIKVVCGEQIKRLPDHDTKREGQLDKVHELKND